MDGNGKRILVVEDNDSVRTLAERILVNKGFSVKTASSAEEALEIFNRERGSFQILFSDVVLPGENGVELAKKLRKQEPSLGILLASGNIDEVVEPEVLKERGFKIIQKPYTLPALTQAINDLLKSR